MFLTQGISSSAVIDQIYRRLGCDLKHTSTIQPFLVVIKRDYATGIPKYSQIHVELQACLTYLRSLATPRAIHDFDARP